MTKTKLKMPVNRWTIFWRNLGVKTLKRSRTIKNYKATTDFNALRRKGVEKASIDRVYRLSLSKKYSDKLFFNKFSRFFRKDPETIKSWLKANSTTEAFDKLFNIIHRGKFEKAKSRFSELDLIFKFYRKGESRIYTANVSKNKSIKFDPKRLILNLNRLDKDSKYNSKGYAELGKDRILCIEKQTPNTEPVYKFIRLSKDNTKLKIGLSMDSKKEYNFAKYYLEKWFNVFIDTPGITKKFNKWEQFITKGESQNFLLTGVTYFDNEFKLSVYPNYNRRINVAALRSYRNRVSNTDKKEEFISQVKLFYKDRSINTPIIVDILSYKNAGILGAIKFVPNDRKMNLKGRSKLYSDFQSDFKMPLNEFLNYKDLAGLGVYKVFLESTPQRTSEIQLRSKVAMQVYQSLLSDGLLSIPSGTDEQTRFCINRSCGEAFKVVWNQRYCNRCGEVLINGKKVIVQRIDENNIVDYINRVFDSSAPVKLSNKLLTRNISVAKVEYFDSMAEVIPITSDIREYQIDVLKFRYPNLIVITSKENVEEYEQMGITALKLYEVVYSLKKEGGKLLKDAISEIALQHVSRARDLCRISSKRINNDIFYKNANKSSKNLGAELFEADCSSLFNYVFGNCLWLGAKYRGKSVPDGFTAFPLLESQQGCFIWDAKFGEGTTLHMGKFDKNRAYIAAAKRNQSIKDNGGLKGFTFISNKKFPPSFLKKYLPLAVGSRIKITFLSADQLLKIVNHFKSNENLITNNAQAKGIFINSMSEIFFKIHSKQKCEIIADVFIENLFRSNQANFKILKAGRPLVV